MSERNSVVVNFGSQTHPSGGLRFGRFGSQPKDEGEQHQDGAQGDEPEAKASPAG